MKKIVSVLSLGILLFGNLTQCFANNNYTEEELGNIMLNFFNAEVEKNNTTTDIQESNTYKPSEIEEEGEDEIEHIGGDEHIIRNKTKGIITVYTGDFSYGISLQDKDLGAGNVGETGLYYQWGNNHGNTSNSEHTADNTRLEYNEKYDNNGYNGDERRFIGFENYQSFQDIWEQVNNNRVSYENLRGGGNDNDNVGENGNINMGYDNGTHKATNIEGRKGPCDNGYHIPSAGEWSELLRIYSKIKNLGIEENIYNGNMTLISAKNGNFKKDLKLTYGGLRDSNINNGTAYYGDSGLYRSSTPYKTPYTSYYAFTTNISTLLNGGETITTYYTYPRANGQTIRCFKNEYITYSKTVTYNPNGGAFSGMEVNQTKEYKYTADENGINPNYNIQIPDRISEDLSQQSGWMFAGWYTKDGSNGDWGEEFDPYEQNASIVYAKWLPFNDLKINMGGKEYIIMDRNLGSKGIAYGLHNFTLEQALKISKEEREKEIENYGYYYQWGNNHGFNSGTNHRTTKNKIIINNEYGPKNYYYSNVYYDGSDNRIENDNKNLRGGEKTSNKDIDKQGPCPKGYHIPDKYEREDIYNSYKLIDREEYCPNYLTRGDDECFPYILKLPYAGNKSLIYNIRGNGNYLFYRSASPNNKNNDDKYSYILEHKGAFLNAKINVFGTNTQSAGIPIRCFKNNENYLKLTLKENNGNDDLNYLLRNWEPISEYTKIPYKTGYEFGGRYYDNNTFNNIIGKEERPTSNINIYAKWIKNPRYKYNANGGKFKSGKETETIKHNIKIVGTGISHTPNIGENGEINGKYENNLDIKKTITIKGAEFLKLDPNQQIMPPSFYKRGYTDYDYAVIRTGKQDNYSIENDEDKAILKKSYWVENGMRPNLTITGDSLTFGFKSYDKGQSLGYYVIINGYANIPDIKTGTPGKTGYSFSGWYETGAIEEFDFNNTPVTKDRTFYAKWNPNHYTIKFDTGDIEDINATYGEEIILQSLTKEGYTFKGWQAEDGTLYKNSIPEGTGLTAEDGATVTLTAQREKIQEPQKQMQTPSAGGGKTTTPTEKGITQTEQEHNSADTVKETETTTQESTPNETTNQSLEEKIQTISPKSLTRGELAVFSNILLDIFPRLTENKKNVNEVCTEYTDYQEFSSKEQKAVSKLCRLAIMGINEDDKTPLETFGVHNLSNNEEFIKVVNRMTDKYSEEELKDLKSALSSLEENKEENLSFGTVVNIFKKVKNLFE